MQFGAFDDERREYIIDTPQTPIPWINYLGTEGFYSLVSNTGGGYAFYQDAKLRRLIRYRYNNVPADMGGRFYYIKDKDTVWSPGFLPTRTKLDRYRCRHGLGYTIIESEKEGIQAELTLFVPLHAHCELNRLRITNTTGATKSLTVFGAVEWCLWNAVDDAQNFQRNLSVGEIEAETGMLYHKTEYRERRNHYAFFGVNVPTAGFDTDRDAFLGTMGDWGLPQAVADGGCTDSLASGWAPIAAHAVELTLHPGESRSLLFLLGYAENDIRNKWASHNVINKTHAHAMMSRFSQDYAVESSFEELKEYWTELLSKVRLSSPDDKLNRMVNIWNQYQCMVTFLISRSASYFESGTGRGMGFRDSCQDILGFVHMIPNRARRRILDIAAVQFEDGSAYHQYQPLTGQGNADVGTGFNDDPLWLIACAAAYIRETGDSSILQESVPFAQSEQSATLFEHLRRSIRYTSSHTGPHGLPLIGRADWNDCLNLNCFSKIPGESFQTCANFESGIAESVFIAAMFVRYGREFAELALHFGDKAEAEEMLAAVTAMEQSVLKHGWDGEWFLRAYDAFGNPVGGNVCDEGKIFIEPQGFCTMAGIGIQEGHAVKALENVERYLTGEHGIQLLNPCYTSYREELGEISSYPPGYKENGGIFCHNNPWISIAYAMLGNGNRAFDAYTRISPAYTENKSDIRRTEPYIYSQMIAGREAARSGEAKNSWLTGTASWAFVNVTQYLLGIQPQINGLRVSPCLPDGMDEFTAERVFRGTRYVIHARRTGKRRLQVDGATINGNIVPLTKTSLCNVEAEF